ncbi:TIGR03560 family F420-dependent LLM class oxidoreductase [Lentzea sp. NPDC051208]|uniref:TIGR03560 family F420-dependent LLM class oxidoreductase n=1 Tax=Lentzea sp. NPDC051208 TaxID=3154642 RepID=UPI00342AFEA4
MRIGLQLVEFNPAGGPATVAVHLRDVAVAAEQTGLDGLWLLDHFFQMPAVSGGAGDPMLECYTTLGYLAAVTERIQLGPLVAGVAYRHPGVLVKTATTLDVLTGGRAWLGVGAGWYEREAVGLGIPFPSLAQRFRLLEDTVRLARHMCVEPQPGPFSGAVVAAPEPLNSPQPVREGGLRLLIGGEGETKTLRLVARYADASNFDAGGSLAQWREEAHDRFRRKLRVLDEHCADAGRDPAEVLRTANISVDLASGGVGALPQIVDDLLELGIGQLNVNFRSGCDTAAVEALGTLAGKMR